MNEGYAEFFPGPKPARAMVRFGADIPVSEGGGCGIHIRSLVFGRHKRCAVFLVIRKPA
jgi:hypothetical protein